MNHIHFIGIGGAGLSAIAKVLIEQGKAVSGSDVASSTTTATLTELGVRVYQGHRAEHVGEAELVVVSAAVRADNPEVLAAQAQGVPVIRREVLLGEMMAHTPAACHPTRVPFGTALSGTASTGVTPSA